MGNTQAAGSPRTLEALQTEVSNIDTLIENIELDMTDARAAVRAALQSKDKTKIELSAQNVLALKNELSHLLLARLMAKREIAQVKTAGNIKRAIDLVERSQLENPRNSGAVSDKMHQVSGVIQDTQDEMQDIYTIEMTDKGAIDQILKEIADENPTVAVEAPVKEERTLSVLDRYFAEIAKPPPEAEFPKVPTRQPTHATPPAATRVVESLY